MAENNAVSTSSAPPSRAASILQRVSSQQQQQQVTHSPPLTRRQSTQERINDIIETGIQRANSMGSMSRASGRRSPRFRPLEQSMEEQDGSPDEHTGITMRNDTRNYQSLRVSSNRSRVSTNTEHVGGSREELSDRNGQASAAAITANKPWWKEYFNSMWSIELESKGSTARDHLALERTFLAWLRTSLAFASIGIAITQLFRLNVSIPNEDRDAIRELGKPLGGVFLGISILVLLLGYQRYLHSQQWIMKGKFPASRGTVVLVSLISFSLMVVSLVIVVVVGRH